MFIKSVILLFFIFALQPQFLQAQSVVDELNESSIDSNVTSELIEEKIQKISPSKRVFIITNDNNGFYKGDFISLIFEDKLVCRAIVAKFSDGSAGIKIIKIYSMDLWNKLTPGLTLKILRGDDSYFRNDKGTTKSDDTLIKEEEDLFNDTILKEDIDLEENTKRLIKPDNVIALTYGQISGVDLDHASTSYYVPSGSWAYQLADNVWGEFNYAQTVIRGFPNLNLDTTLSVVGLKIKYTIAAPFDSYVLPYLGFKVTSATSPSAGTSASTGAEELQLLDQLEGSDSIAFGVTLLKRFVPAWFMRVDLGTDIIAGGLALEF